MSNKYWLLSESAQQIFLYKIPYKTINLRVIQQNINMFTQEPLYPSFILKKKLVLSVADVFKTSTFYHISTTYDSDWGL